MSEEDPPRAVSATDATPAAIDRASLRAAIADADLRVLVMCLFHLSGDAKWLEPPYQPARDVRLIADPAAGYPELIQREIRDAAEALLADRTEPPAIGDPGPEQFHHMMSVCLGEKVPPEYVRLVREEMGFADRDASWTDARPHDLDLDVVIAGAGVAGLCLAAKLDALGIPFTIVEKNADVGGTWFENRYPGCGVDTPNHFYSYSFAPNPGWRHYFSPRDELQAYVEDCATAFGVRDRIRFRTELLSARWDGRACRWDLTVRTPEGTEVLLRARVFVSATGHFNQPLDVPFEGAGSFEGELFHTARWPDAVSLEGKRVGVIGTGASSMQVVPTVVDDVERLTIFQRSAQWARPIPEYNLPVAPASRWLFERVPYYAEWYRFTQFWRYGDGLLRFLRKDPDWTDPARSLNRTNDRHRNEMTEYIHEQLVRRPELIPHCVPGYPPFGKRILIDNGWFATLCRPHVSLVTDTIDRIEPRGVRTDDGSLHELDVLVMATGFTITNLAARIDIRGRDGVTLAEDWADEDPSAYLGMTVPGFPNFFVMYGPNTNMGHGGSGIFLAETQTRYITGCLVAMAERDVAAVECPEHLRTAYTERIDALHEDLVWTHPGMSTYYRNQNGKVRSPMPFRLVDYWALTRDPDLEELHVTPRSGLDDG